MNTLGIVHVGRSLTWPEKGALYDALYVWRVQHFQQAGSRYDLQSQGDGPLAYWRLMRRHRQVCEMSLL